MPTSVLGIGARETVVADALEAVRQHVADAKLAPQLAEIGVILLMFGVGMCTVRYIVYQLTQ